VSVVTIDTNLVFSFFMQELGNRNGMGALLKPSAFAGPSAFALRAMAGQDGGQGTGVFRVRRLTLGIAKK
jgi:hypothetical protein